ncbi:MAG TPA: fumarylacetoacetate hydrolase family protein [Clostridia bacterium]|nr:fumarylacetoacetate hydrolase family protein [Clostridia bacterium]
MRYARARLDGEEFYALIEGDTLVRLLDRPFDKVELDGRKYPLSKARLIAPCEPSKIVCVGKNYWAHAEEMKEGHPAEPLLFLKPSTCVIGPEDEVVYPKLSHRLDYEGELGVVIGKKARNVASGTARAYIFGYTCLNDVTARDIQKGDPQWTRGKSFDTFCPLGPWIETELDAGHVRIRTRLNGETKQDSNTALMTYDVDALICYMSACMTLLPGDVIATGTPEGIGSMQRDDVIEVEIEGVGVLRNRIAAE